MASGRTKPTGKTRTISSADKASKTLACFTSVRANPMRTATAGSSGKIYPGSLLVAAEKNTNPKSIQYSKNLRLTSKYMDRRNNVAIKGVQGSKAAIITGA